MPDFVHVLMSHPLIALFAIIGLGLLIGGITIKDINLGSSGVLFVALAAGHFGYKLPDGVGNIGLVLFVYCVGIGAGGRFFSVLAREGANLAKLALLIVALGSAVCWAAARLLDLPAGLVTGIFAGALTSTPALAAATEGVKNAGGDLGDVIVGYGIAYPFGVVGVVLFVQVLPRLLRADLDRVAAEQEGSTIAESKIETTLVEVANPALVGRPIAESALSGFSAIAVSRVLRGEKLEPVRYDETFALGQILVLVGRPRELELAIQHLGRRSERVILRDVDNERQTLLVTRKQVLGRTLREINPLKDFGVVVTRVTRLGLTFVPDGNTRLENADGLTVVGKTDDLKRFAAHVGHRPQGFDQTDLLSLSVGLSLGIIVGLVPIGLPGAGSITLGLAGGPLLVALVLGHFGRVGRIVGHIPRNTRLMLQEFGLVLFLADAGVRGGEKMVATLQTYGLSVFLVGLAATTLPMLVALPVALRGLKLNILQSLGGICGGMTSTPALGALAARTPSQQPVISYASAYPVALIMMTLFAKLLLQLAG